MRFICFLGLMMTGCVVSEIRSELPPIPADWASDDVITLIYNPIDGSLALDNPAGDSTAADAITTFELVSSVDFFTGPAPAGFDGLFDVWT